MNKCIYQISFDFSYALADISKQKGDVSSLDLFDDTPELIHQFDYDWITADSAVIPDLILIMSKLLGVSMKAYQIIESLLSGIESVDVELSNHKFKILTNIPLMTNTLNIRKSKITRFSTGDIMSIEIPIFLPRNYPPLFKIEEAPTSFFCSELLYKIIVNSNLTGWRFESRPIKSKSWL
ncbi:hypothetical protein ACILDU_11125 [Capnocytophaga canimorsus]|uniref:hypothetical protein n=1 Tax=Capnocytophaga canimorsus TaxID=28188 RepID=UPI0037CFAFA6